MKNSNLIPKDLSKRKDHIKLSQKGGQAKTPSKVFASKINGYLANKELTPSQMCMIKLIKQNDIVGLLKELITVSLKDIHDYKRRERLIDQLIKLLPEKVINIDLSQQKTNLDMIKFKELIEKYENEEEDKY